MTTRLLRRDPTTVTGGEGLAVLTQAAMRVAGPLALALVAGAALTRGVAGALTAAGSAVVLLGLHVGSGRLSARLAEDRPQLMPIITMLGLLVRLGVYGALVVLLRGVPGLDVPTLAVTVIGLTVAVLVTESVVVARYSRFWWQPTEAAQPAADRKD